MPDRLVNVAETPLFAQALYSGHLFVTNDDRWGPCSVFIHRRWEIGDAHAISLRLSTRASAESVPVTFHRSSDWGEVFYGSNNTMWYDTERWLLRSKLIPNRGPFVRTLHVTCFIHEEAPE